MKLKFFAISILAAGTVFAATYALSKTSKPIIATGVPVSHVVEITRFAYPVVYSGSHSSTKQYPVADLDNAGNYCYFDDQAFLSPSFNTDGHLIEASKYVGSPVFFLMLNQKNADEKNLFATKEDSYDIGKRINLFGFADITRMDFQVGEGNAVDFVSDNVDVTCAYDADTKTYSFTGTFPNTYFGPSFSGATTGTRLVIDKITLYYNC